MFAISHYGNNQFFKYKYLVHMASHEHRTWNFKENVQVQSTFMYQLWSNTQLIELSLILWANGRYEALAPGY